MKVFPSMHLAIAKMLLNSVNVLHSVSVAM